MAKIAPHQLLLIVVLYGACIASFAVPCAAFDLTLTPLASGLTEPVGLANAGDSRLFALESQGVIRIIQSNGTVIATPFLDLTDRVDSSDFEEGLLGLAFHDNYATNGFFYVNYTATDGRTRISRFSVTADPSIADPASEDILLTVDLPTNIHHAGAIAFGPDGFLYIPMGDGGGQGDPLNNAQSLSTLLGKIVRIDVDSGPPGSVADCSGAGSGNYTVPVSNPLVDGNGGTCDEIWALGLRNPWRSSFDRSTGDLWIGDVGLSSYEEIDRQPAGSAGGENYGWRCYEGDHTFNTAGCDPIGSYTFPVFEYLHSDNDGCAVIGGFVYRGSQFPTLAGRYLLTDFCTGYFWDLAPENHGSYTATRHTELAGSGNVAFGEDASGELYIVNITAGTVSLLGSDPVGITVLVPTIAEWGIVVLVLGLAGVIYLRTRKINLI